MSFLEIRGLSKDLGEFSLKEVDLDLETGTYLAVIGPTGAGKTILLECLVGFYLPEAGHILLEGEDITRCRPEHRHIGIVYQDFALLPHMDVRRNIGYGLRRRLRGETLDNRVREMAEVLRIDHLLHRAPGTLSGGEKQRVALARSLIVKPRLLLMDEPFSALDPRTRRKLRRLLRRVIKETGTTVIHVTHDLDDVWSLADEVAFLRHGQLVQSGTVQEVMQRPRRRCVADFLGINLFHGQVRDRRDGVCRIQAGEMELVSTDRAQPGEEVRVAIRPEQVILAERCEGPVSTRNVLTCNVVDIFPENGVYLVELERGGSHLSAVVTYDALQDLRLAPGSAVTALIKSTHVAIVG
ncbi:ABC transporter ATP-binding protein [Desulfohalobium retbaense]|uniref:Molybdate ABC transporter, ATPase subunit n=1 Tax=Desulfohalobium retbaense (strain ATCC 49708 / DSM 5692 / JCM 16813 / HR100) TaxID=485915 RepID=C8X3V6_DESRD|nr:ATP-binding cassette domain-containing protein [Desulfohalobium retbaense]ACV69103.1 molybdate ABC transporter, ATPase subunit [Desulfohalobium retbaense DSM 5692]